MYGLTSTQSASSTVRHRGLGQCESQACIREKARKNENTLGKKGLEFSGTTHLLLLVDRSNDFCFTVRTSKTFIYQHCRQPKMCAVAILRNLPCLCFLSTRLSGLRLPFPCFLSPRFHVVHFYLARHVRRARLLRCREQSFGLASCDCHDCELVERNKIQRVICAIFYR
jgi:hypothetical protein